jgi:hypothetical protein
MQRAVVIAVVLAATCECVDHRTLLWVPPEAAIIRPATVYPSGNVEVSFTLPIANFNQKDAFTARLSQRLEQTRWRRRSHQYLNPIRATSFDQGWKRAGSGIRHPTGRSSEPYTWNGEWEDVEGNVIQYTLLASPLREGEGDQIRCYAAYVPVELVRAGPNGDYR